jgi:hypothetical protein
MTMSQFRCDVCQRDFSTKQKLNEHNNKYHSENQCKICCFKCNNIEEHIIKCEEYNNKIKKLYSEINNNNDIIDKLKAKFNNPEYENIYKFSYLLFVYSKVFPDSCFMPSNLLGSYLGYKSHQAILKLTNKLENNIDYVKKKTEFINIINLDLSTMDKCRLNQEEPVYLNYRGVLKIFMRSTRPVAQKHSEIILFSYDLIMDLHSKQKISSLEDKLDSIDKKLTESHKVHEETRKELSLKLDESNKKLDAIQSQKEEVIKELHEIQMQNRILTMKIDQLRKCQENNISEINRGNATLSAASTQLSQLATQVTQPSSIKEPDDSKLQDTLIILHDGTDYVYACRQHRNINSFIKKYSEYVEFARYTNINNSKYCMSFLEKSNIIFDKEIRRFKSELSSTQFKRTLNKYIKKFKTITESTKDIEELINNANNILKISTEDNTEY